MTIVGDERSQVRTIWLLCCFVTGIGMTCVWWPNSQRLHATRAQQYELYEEANQNDAELKRGTELVSARSRFLNDVATLRGQSSGTTATAVALTSISDEAKQYRILVRSLIPQPDTTVSGRLDRTDIALAVSGHFRNLVAFIADLPRHASLIGINGVTIGIDRASSADPSMLDVTIRASLYRVQNTILKENTHASGAP